MTQVGLALALGTLFALGTFLILRRDVVRVIWGVVLGLSCVLLPRLESV